MDFSSLPTDLVNKANNLLNQIHYNNKPIEVAEPPKLSSLKNNLILWIDGKSNQENLNKSDRIIDIQFPYMRAPIKTQNDGLSFKGMGLRADNVLRDISNSNYTLFFVAKIPSKKQSTLFSFQENETPKLSLKYIKNNLVLTQTLSNNIETETIKYIYPNDTKIITFATNRENNINKLYINKKRKKIKGDYILSQSANIFSIGVSWASLTDPVDWWNSDVYEVIIYNKELSDKSINLIHNYLNKKWNLSL
jgi:hypothetical protein